MATIGRPFGVLLMFLYEFFSSYGVAVILIALVIRIVLLPFEMKGKLGSMRAQRVQPKVQEIQKKYASDKAKAQQETMKLYKEENASPTSGCLWNLLPIPIMFALFFVISQPITMMMGVPAAYTEPEGAIYQRMEEVGFDFEEGGGGRHVQIVQAQFIHDHFEEFEEFEPLGLRAVNFRSFGMDLGRTPWSFIREEDWSDSSTWGVGILMVLIPLLSGGFQLLHTKINQKIAPPGSPEGAGGQMRTMMMIMPLFSVFIGFTMPAALGLYWTAGTVLIILRDVWLTKRYNRVLDAEYAVRNAERDKKEKELEEKRKEAERRKAEGGEETRNLNTSKRKQQSAERQADAEKAAEWKKKNSPQDGKEIQDEPSRVDDRRYARGRAYDPDRYPDVPEDKNEDDGYPDEVDIEDEAEDIAEIEETEFEAEAVAEAEELGDDEGLDEDDSE
ncbi:MAG: YidC/Oxa1 family membrane protein insertase [Oscillospiraceae bacterium]|nr:YidC/Oxa1 family membrane protein insertase [Oscillospiraceae bacterium]